MEATLSAQRVTVAVGGRSVLSGVSCVVRPGEVLGLLAPSGAGKSTLLRALVGLVEVADGTIEFEGAEIASLDPRVLRRKVALVAQAPVMLPGTVADNLRYGVAGLAADGLIDALSAAGLEGSFAGREAAALSGGERSRVALARALTRNPRLLLLDEPTAALDGPTAERIGRTLRRLAGLGLGICIATHDLSFAEAWTDRRQGLE